MKTRSIALLVAASLAGMSLWFVSAAVLPEMAREASISPFRQALMSSGVQGGFVVGALLSAFLGLPDRIDPRRLFALCSVLAGLANATLLVAPIGGDLAVAARIATGALLAGVYPVGMKIAVGWGQRDRGLLVSLLIGALTLGAAAPHLAALMGGADWRATVLGTSILACLGGLLALAAGLGPYHAQARRFDPTVIATAWTDRRIRLAYGGYFGHMWELYSMWAWIAAAATVSFAATMDQIDAERLARLVTFFAIALGAVFCVIAGAWADRFGKAETTIIAMIVSGAAALATALTFGGPAWATALAILIWGASISPDSAQFSALVADAAPPEQAGSLMTLQTALGFTLTFFTVQATPVLAEAIGWAPVLGAMAVGPALGVLSMRPLRRSG